MALLGLLALGIALCFLRSSLNLALAEAATRCAAVRESHETLVRQVESVRVEIERDVTLARLGPRAERLGLGPPPPEAVTLLAAAPRATSVGARPLPDSGVLGRLVGGATALARVRRAVAAPVEGGGAVAGSAAVPRTGTLLAATPAALGAGGEACRCEFCDRTAGR